MNTTLSIVLGIFLLGCGRAPESFETLIGGYWISDGYTSEGDEQPTAPVAILQFVQSVDGSNEVVMWGPAVGANISSDQIQEKFRAVMEYNDGELKFISGFFQESTDVTFVPDSLFIDLFSYKEADSHKRLKAQWRATDAEFELWAQEGEQSDTPVFVHSNQFPDSVPVPRNSDY